MAYNNSPSLNEMLMQIGQSWLQAKQVKEHRQQQALENQRRDDEIKRQKDFEDWKKEQARLELERANQVTPSILADIARVSPELADATAQNGTWNPQWANIQSQYKPTTIQSETQIQPGNVAGLQAFFGSAPSTMPAITAPAQRSFARDYANTQAAKNAPDPTTPVDILRLIGSLGQTYGTGQVQSLLGQAGLGDYASKLNGKNRWETTEGNKDIRSRTQIGQARERQANSVAISTISAIYARKLPPVEAAQQGMQAWQTLVDNKIVPPNATAPDFQSIATTMSPEQAAQEMQRQWSRAVDSANFDFKVDKYIAESANPSAQYPRLPAAVPGFNAPQGSSGVFAMSGGKLPMRSSSVTRAAGGRLPPKAEKANPEKKTLPTQMGTGNRDKAQMLGFSSTAIKYGPNEVLRNIGYYTSKGWLGNKKTGPNWTEIKKRVDEVNKRYEGKSTSTTPASTDTPTRQGILKLARQRKWTAEQTKAALRAGGF